MILCDDFMYRLYDETKYSTQDKRRFISDNRVDRVTDTCGDRQWPVLADDKWICYSLLQAAGFPVPRTLAVIDRTLRSFGRERKIE
jgi:hypothetical protein